MFAELLAVEPGPAEIGDTAKFEKHALSCGEVGNELTVKPNLSAIGSDIRRTIGHGCLDSPVRHTALPTIGRADMFVVVRKPPAIGKP